jgi:hypothetical protein
MAITGLVGAGLVGLRLIRVAPFAVFALAPGRLVRIGLRPKAAAEEAEENEKVKLCLHGGVVYGVKKDQTIVACYLERAHSMPLTTLPYTP